MKRAKKELSPVEETARVKVLEREVNMIEVEGDRDYKMRPSPGGHGAGHIESRRLDFFFLSIVGSH